MRNLLTLSLVSQAVDLLSNVNDLFLHLRGHDLGGPISEVLQVAAPLGQMVEESRAVLARARPSAEAPPTQPGQERFIGLMVERLTLVDLGLRVANDGEARR